VSLYKVPFRLKIPLHDRYLEGNYVKAERRGDDEGESGDELKARKMKKMK
jgi:hypothetical protein